MSFYHYSLLTSKRLLIIVILYNYVSKLNCLDVLSKTKSDLGLKKFNPLHLQKNIEEKKLSIIIPKKFTADKISTNGDLYLGDEKNEDIYLNGTQLIRKYGYKVEEHRVKTSDGYKLTMYRIPGNGRAVFLMHGLMSSFADWLTAGPNQALAYLLAAEGYDVWMGNARGNTFSRDHERLSPLEVEFWDFSFNEIGSIDLPAMMDYVLMKTGKKKLTYIGHSQGATAFFVLCSTKPEYNDKIDIMIALGAVAWMKHIESQIFRIAALNDGTLYDLSKALGFIDFIPDNDLKKIFTQTFCSESFSAYLVCQSLVFLLGGYNPSQVNYKQLPVIFSHFPAGYSFKQIVHYTQLITSGYFRKFDNGLHLNLKMYGSVSPPSYPLHKITAPIAIFYSHGDWVAKPIDVDHLRSNLKNVVDYYEIPLRTFSHYDFLWGKDVKKLIYNRVLTLIKQN